MNTSNTEIPHINQNVIECDLRAFTRWLNTLADQVNWVSKVYVALKAQVDENTEDIRQLRIDLNALTLRVNDIDERLTILEGKVEALDLETIEQLIEMVNGRVDLLYGWLPIPYGMIDAKGWKFAMGNISVMSDNNNTPSVNGPGIFTANQIEDNDVYFN